MAILTPSSTLWGKLRAHLSTQTESNNVHINSADAEVLLQ